MLFFVPLQSHAFTASLFIAAMPFTFFLCGTFITLVSPFISNTVVSSSSHTTKTCLFIFTFRMVVRKARSAMSVCQSTFKIFNRLGDKSGAPVSMPPPLPTHATRRVLRSSSHARIGPMVSNRCTTSPESTRTIRNPVPVETTTHDASWLNEIAFIHISSTSSSSLFIFKALSSSLSSLSSSSSRVVVFFFPPIRTLL